VSRPIGACGPARSQIRAACRGSFPPIEKRIPITAGDPNFVPAGDLFPGARIQSLAVIEHFLSRDVSWFESGVFQVHEDEFGAHPTMDSTVGSDPRRQRDQSPAVADEPSEPTFNIVAHLQKFAAETGAGHFQEVNGSRSALTSLTMSKTSAWFKTRRDQLQLSLGNTLVV